MPKKKKGGTGPGRTKLSRAKTVKEMDGNSSMCSIGESHRKKETLVAFLQDFDIEVEKRVQSMKSDINKMCSEVTNILKMEIMKLPKHIRQMKLTDFQARGGEINSVMLSEVSEAATEGVIPEPSRAPQPPVANHLHPIEEEKQQVTKAATTGKRKRVRAAKNTNVNVANILTGGPGTRTRTRGGATNTPAMQRVQNVPMQTPTFTPRFDPSHPPQSAARKPLAGESLWSSAGSPITFVGSSIENSLMLGIQDGQSPKMFGKLLDMSPNSLANQEQFLLKVQAIVDRKIQLISDVSNK